MDSFRPKALTVQAEHYEEQTLLKIGQAQILVPAKHTAVYYPGGVVVTPTEDFNALWMGASVPGGPVKRSYE